METDIVTDALSIGTKVWAAWTQFRYYSGVVTGITDAGIEVAFDDGDHLKYSQDWSGEIVIDRQPRANELYKDVMVIVKMPARKVMYRGKILSKSKSRGYCICFDEIARKKAWKRSVSLKIIRKYILVKECDEEVTEQGQFDQVALQPNCHYSLLSQESITSPTFCSDKPTQSYDSESFEPQLVFSSPRAYGTSVFELKNKRKPISPEKLPFCYDLISLNSTTAGLECDPYAITPRGFPLFTSSLESSSKPQTYVPTSQFYGLGVGHGTGSSTGVPLFSMATSKHSLTPDHCSISEFDPLCRISAFESSFGRPMSNVDVNQTSLRSGYIGSQFTESVASNLEQPRGSEGITSTNVSHVLAPGLGQNTTRADLIGNETSILYSGSRGMVPTFLPENAYSTPPMKMPCHDVAYENEMHANFRESALHYPTKAPEFNADRTMPRIQYGYQSLAQFSSLPSNPRFTNDGKWKRASDFNQNAEMQSFIYSHQSSTQPFNNPSTSGTSNDGNSIGDGNFNHDDHCQSPTQFNSLSSNFRGLKHGGVSCTGYPDPAHNSAEINFEDARRSANVRHSTPLQLESLNSKTLRHGCTQVASSRYDMAPLEQRNGFPLLGRPHLLENQPICKPLLSWQPKRKRCNEVQPSLDFNHQGQLSSLSKSETSKSAKNYNQAESSTSSTSQSTAAQNSHTETEQPNISSAAVPPDLHPRVSENSQSLKSPIPHSSDSLDFKSSPKCRRIEKECSTSRVYGSSFRATESDNSEEFTIPVLKASKKKICKRLLNFDAVGSIFSPPIYTELSPIPLDSENHSIATKEKYEVKLVVSTAQQSESLAVGAKSLHVASTSLSDESEPSEICPQSFPTRVTAHQDQRSKLHELCTRLPLKPQPTFRDGESPASTSNYDQDELPKSDIQSHTIQESALLAPQKKSRSIGPSVADDLKDDLSANVNAKVGTSDAEKIEKCMWVKMDHDPVLDCSRPTWPALEFVDERKVILYLEASEKIL